MEAMGISDALPPIVCNFKISIRLTCVRDWMTTWEEHLTCSGSVADFYQQFIYFFFLLQFRIVAFYIYCSCKCSDSSRCYKSQWTNRHPAHTESNRATCSRCPCLSKEGLDQMTSRYPSQSQPFCDHVNTLLSACNMQKVLQKSLLCWKYLFCCILLTNISILLYLIIFCVRGLVNELSGFC